MSCPKCDATISRYYSVFEKLGRAYCWHCRGKWSSIINGGKIIGWETDITKEEWRENYRLWQKNCFLAKCLDKEARREGGENCCGNDLF